MFLSDKAFFVGKDFPFISLSFVMSLICEPQAGSYHRVNELRGGLYSKRNLGFSPTQRSYSEAIFRQIKSSGFFVPWAEDMGIIAGFLVGFSFLAATISEKIY